MYPVVTLLHQGADKRIARTDSVDQVNDECAEEVIAASRRRAGDDGLEGTVNAFALRDVFDGRDEVFRFTVRIARQRHGQVGPDALAGFADIALLDGYTVIVPVSICRT